MRQCAPNTCLLAELLNIFDVVVGEVPELFDYSRVLVGVFVRTDVYLFPSENRILPFQLFLEKIVYKLIGLRIEQVQMVHSVFLTPYFGFVLGKGQ